VENNLTLIFKDVSCWYVIVALFVSAYHGYRGYVLQRWTAKTQKYNEETKIKKEEIEFQWFMSDRETFIVRILYEVLFYFVCSVIGFVSLWFAASVFNKLPNIYDIPGGTGGLLAFFVVLGILGVCGILPYIIQLGKMPR